LASKYQIKNAEQIIDKVKIAVTKWQELATVAGVSKTTIESLEKILKKQNSHQHM